jgi:hypothetical protein
MTLTLRVTAGLRALHSHAYFHVRLLGESSFKRMGSAHLKRVSSTELSATLLNCGAKELAPRALRDGVAFM